MSKILRQVALTLVFAYRIISPALHFLVSILTTRFQCRFAQSCSEFAIEEIRFNPSLLNALSRVAQRIFICSPFMELFSNSKIDAVSMSCCAKRGS